MFQTFTFNSAWEAYEVLRKFMDSQPEEESRNGKVKSCPRPVAIEFTNPTNRVLISQTRDPNPFFHLFESLWMLAGGDEVKFVKEFNSNIINYSDDGHRFNAAYGYRWRHHFKIDQLLMVVSMLRDNPEDRRVVLGMWDPHKDLMSRSKDVPCNTHTYFRVVDGKLNMTTMNRSNDLIWGLMGANCVHLSIMHEWVAKASGVPIGKWFHMTNNLHVYERHWPLLVAEQDCYMNRGASIIGDAYKFLGDCQELVRGSTDFREDFFIKTVAPMLGMWRVWKSGDKKLAIQYCWNIHHEDWRKACLSWAEKRMG